MHNTDILSLDAELMPGTCPAFFMPEMAFVLVFAAIMLLNSCFGSSIVLYCNALGHYINIPPQDR